MATVGPHTRDRKFAGAHGAAPGRLQDEVYAHPGGDLRATAGAGIDVKAKGYAVAEFSTVGGRSYRWEDPDAPVSVMPEWLAVLVRRPPRTAPHRPRFARLVGDRPGDAFNASTTWEQVLEPAGWQRIGDHGEVSYWRRPGKRREGVSATTGNNGSDALYVFSTMSAPLESGRSYDRFGAFAALYHHGDFAAAARALRGTG